MFKKIIFILTIFCLIIPNGNFARAENLPKLAIVIDDFGQDRHGIKEMLSVKAPLTCAIMPEMEFSAVDAFEAHKFGHEVILHMPMEANVRLPRSWYGKLMIGVGDSTEHAAQLFEEALESVPFAVGANIHIGSGVSENKRLMTRILEIVKDRNMFFLDSLTSEKTVCKIVAEEVGAKLVTRDEFLEKTGSPSYDYAKKKLYSAYEKARTNGYAIVIGHVGPEGGTSTAKAISDFIAENKNVQIVPLSEIVSEIYG